MPAAEASVLGAHGLDCEVGGGEDGEREQAEQNGHAAVGGDQHQAQAQADREHCLQEWREAVATEVVWEAASGLEASVREAAERARWEAGERARERAAVVVAAVMVAAVGEASACRRTA
eukprot:scaffold8275_cov61-Phaeocystis_antarctica.AAC.9